MTKENITISTDFIKLDALLKFSAVCSTGGEAKVAILNGDVAVNGIICTQRGKKIMNGDVVTVGGQIEIHVQKGVNE